MRSVDQKRIKEPLSREFLVAIGRKGGLAGKDSERKRQSARAAANARWKLERNRGVTLTNDGQRLVISRSVPGLATELRYHERRKVEGTSRLVAVRRQALFRDRGVLWTFAGLFERTHRYLKRKGIPVHVRWKARPTYEVAQVDFEQVTANLNYRQRREIVRLMKLPFGGVCEVPQEARVEVMGCVLNAFSKAPAVVVVEELERLHAMAEHLHRILGESIGILTDRMTDDQRITLMTPAHLNSGIIAPQDCGVLIFDRCPRTGRKRLMQSLAAFPLAWKLAFLGDEKWGRDRRFLVEVLFGPIVKFNSW